MREDYGWKCYASRKVRKVRDDLMCNADLDYITFSCDKGIHIGTYLLAPCMVS